MVRRRGRHLNWHLPFKTIKQAIHISSKMEFSEHGKEKAIVSFKKRWKLAQRNGNAGVQTNSKSNTSCADSNLGPRLEDSDTSKDRPTLRPRVEGRNGTRNLSVWEEEGLEWVEFCDFESCLKTNFGASVNDVPHFST
ncbi:hypothetical protein AVEN_138287-1 [Araneus ventricosus]|uniref:Uncharacterized protein n=1 Tax=Araneus ventricosus TaxID=182803 RepID=A0A4Y2ITA9_ARAVE|nr:hypothetical protein AVEN_138287-1 [Araneus ventricosus]